MKRIYRSQRDKKLFGLCGGLAELLDVDATLLRLIFVITAIFSAGTMIAIYVLASLVIPKEPVAAGYGYGGWQGHGYGPEYGPEQGHGYQGNHGPSGPFGHNGPFGGEYGFDSKSARRWAKQMRRWGKFYGEQWQQGWKQPHQGPGSGTMNWKQPQQSPNVQHPLDDMMPDIEKKAMQRELEELRAKVAKMEQTKSVNEEKGE
ncbi:PspC domain-containing protein [Paenibacillus sp. y28]|uniref:PspC domain-containing protein n=1 Tax=Paenibacillus sp. y28 TaxID=3129110 RepID=UPI003018BEA7